MSRHLNAENGEGWDFWSLLNKNVLKLCKHLWRVKKVLSWCVNELYGVGIYCLQREAKGDVIVWCDGSCYPTDSCFSLKYFLSIRHRKMLYSRQWQEARFLLTPVESYDMSSNSFWHLFLFVFTKHIQVIKIDVANKMLELILQWGRFELQQCERYNF